LRITVIEDNESVARGIAYVLRDAGHAVDLIHDGAEAELFLRHEGSDLIVLDINLPGMDGISLLKSIRKRGDSRPVILLTARAETDDRVQGLDAGADDYLVKPFDMAELEARIRALSRRKPERESNLQTLGALTWDAAARTLFIHEDAIELPRRELALFEALMEARGRTLTKSALLDQLYGVGSDVEEKVVEVYVSRLRKRLKTFGISIRVRRGLGYELEVEPS